MRVAFIMRSITLIKPDDWHLHLRDGEALNYTVKSTARFASRAIIMPNLRPPIVTVEQALAYRERILSHLETNTEFNPLMTLYLTENTQKEDIKAAANSDYIQGVKLYPAGATTNSDSGVSNLKKLYPILEEMQKEDLPLLIHGEVTEVDTDIFDREKIFIQKYLIPLQKEFPALRVVLEHITTKDAVDYVKTGPQTIAATITPQHLMYNRNHMLVGGIKPHLYCLPILKANIHQKALREVVKSGHPKFFLGTDSAPHAKRDKENACGCAGCFSAPFAIELYAQIFEEMGVIDKLEGFASIYGANFYRLPVNQSKITLTREEQIIPESMEFADNSKIVPLGYGQVIKWKLSLN